MTYTTGTIRLEATKHHVTLPRVGRIQLLESSSVLDRLIEQGEARKSGQFLCGRWVVSLSVRVSHSIPIHHRHPGTTVGVDVGVANFVVAATPDGKEVLCVSLPNSEKFWITKCYKNYQW